MGGIGSFSSQLKVHHGREVKVARAWSIWPHYVYSLKRALVTGCSLPFLHLSNSGSQWGWYHLQWVCLPISMNIIKLTLPRHAHGFISWMILDYVKSTFNSNHHRVLFVIFYNAYHCQLVKIRCIVPGILSWKLEFS